MIAELLKIGADKSTTAVELMRETGLTRRQLYKAVADDRKEGIFILTDGSGGYYLPDVTDARDREKLRQFTERMKSTAIELFTISKSARDYLKGGKGGVDGREKRAG